MSEVKTIELPLDEIREYCASQPIARLSLFGTSARDELRTDSDVDMLVEYLPDARVGLFALSGHRLDLTEIVGRAVDLSTPKGLSPYIRDEVLESARLIYGKKS